MDADECVSAKKNVFDRAHVVPDFPVDSLHPTICKN